MFVGKKLYSTVMIVFSILFLVIFLSSIFDNKSIIVVTTPFLSIISLFIVGVLLIFIYKFIIKKVKKISPLSMRLLYVSF